VFWIWDGFDGNRCWKFLVLVFERWFFLFTCFLVKLDWHFCDSADDSMAILMAFQSPEVEVLGLTSVFGNTSTELSTRNALLLVRVHCQFFCGLVGSTFSGTFPSYNQLVHLILGDFKWKVIYIDAICIHWFSLLENLKLFYLLIYFFLCRCLCSSL